VNKYWLGEEEWICVLCRKGRECMEHFIEECEYTKNWFIEIGKDKKEIIESICGANSWMETKVEY